MRNFRKAAVAAATALTVGLAGTSVATAQSSTENPENTETNGAVQVEKGDAQHDRTAGPDVPTGSSVWAITHNLFGDQEVYDEDGNPTTVTGQDLLGEEKAENIPNWAENWRTLGIVGAVGTLVGAIIGIINALRYQGILPS